MHDHGRMTSAAYPLRATWLLLVAVLFQWGCEKTVVSVVEVSEVDVDPTELTLLEGARETLTVLVTDEAGTQLARANVTWTVDDEEVVSVDQQGGVVALAPGSTRVQATVRGVTGSATVTVMQGPTLALSRSTVELESTAGDSDPITTEVDVRNAGNGALDQLSARVEGSSGASSAWLGVELLGTSAPTRLRLDANPEGLEAGTYEARVVVESPAAAGEPAELTVRLIVEAVDGPDDPDDPEDPGPTCDIRNRIIFGSLEVPRETSCTIFNVRVLGDLKLERGASVNATQLRVDGKLEAKAAAELVLADSRILRELKFEEGGRVTIRETDVGGDLVLKKNRGELEVRDSDIGDDLSLEDNRDGPFTIVGNTVGDDLQCKDNTPAPTGGGNVVGDEKEGQCRGL